MTNVSAIQALQAALTASDSVSQQSDVDFSSYLKTSKTLDEIYTEASQTYGVSEELLKAMTKQESSFRTNATSRSGAQGLMQLMPATARSLGVTDSYDPYQNIMGGTKYISQMLQEYNGDISLALAAYNAGSNNVAKYGGIPPFKETQNYVVKVTQFMNEGVAAPNASYAVNSGSQNGPARGSIQAATVEEAEESYYQSILEQLFSYEDYLKFIELYTKIQEAQQEKEQEEAQKQEGESDSYRAYQDLKFNPVAMNLLGGGI